MKGLWWRYAIATAALLTAIVLDMFNPYFVGQLIDRVIENGEMSYLKTALIGIAAITLVRGVFGYIKSYGFDLASSEVILRFRKKLFDHIQKLSFSFFDENNTGELMSRIKEDMDNVMNAICYGFSLFMEQLIYIVIASVILFTTNWKLAIISIITLPLIEYIVFLLERKIGFTYEKISDQRAVLNTTAQQNISGVRLVKALSRERYEISKFLKQNEVNYKINFEQAQIMSKYNPPIEFLSNVVLVLIISFGGNMVINGNLSLGTLVAFSNYIYMLIWPMRMMGWLTSTIAQCIASVKKIDKIFKEEPTIKECEKPVHLDDVQGHVAFKNVSFEFGGSKVLDNIIIDAKPGSKIAIMGITGSGKTSLINLIGRYYDCTSGEVLFDGVNVKDMELSQLRKNVSVVMQDTFLFSDTIEENIKFGCENVSEAEFTAAVQDSMVDEFVSQMPQGYRSVIGERGLGLSGGQKQRVSIARALVRPSKVLVLDDSTSALDMETEYRIQKALEKRKGVTCFIIAHRISAVKNADEILYFENGRIVERGNHEELMKLGGRYYDTYCEQYSDYAETMKKEVI
jgi:ATP-binding cassette subfamily B protein